MTWTDGLGLLAAIAGTVGSAYPAWLWGRKQYKQMLLKRKERDNMFAQMACQFPRLMQGMENIQKELVTNGGSTLKDALNRIERRQLLHKQAHQNLAAEVGSLYFETDEAGDWKEVSPSVAMRLGCQPIDLLGSGWTSYVMQATREEVIQEWDRCIEERIDFNLEFVMFSTTGERIVVVMTTKAVRDGALFAGYFGRVRVSTLKSGT